MKIQTTMIAFILIFSVPPFFSDASTFISKRESFNNHDRFKDSVMIASPGRCGSTMLTDLFQKYMSPLKVFKTHLLTPDRNFPGKIIFIFCNPDLSAESALFRILHGNRFGGEHFSHVETADRQWLRRIGGPFNQTEEENLLSYDALGNYKHLFAWLHTRTAPAPIKKAQILAIKFENLWDHATLIALRKFLNIPHLQLPSKEERGHTEDELLPQEIIFRNIYNLGTENQPRYQAYDKARAVWKKAPPFQFLRITSSHH